MHHPQRLVALLFATLLAASLPLPARSSKKQVSPKARARALALLAPMASYSEKTPYSPAAQTLMLGYDADKNVKAGIALRAFKTYEWVTALVMVEEQQGKYVITHAEIPDIDRIANAKKRKKVLDVLGHFKGKTLDAGSNGKTVDAMTGATRYRKRIYLYVDKMGEALLQEMKSNPTWPRKPIR